MFSGLTNQVSSWMGAAKGEPQDEEVPTPTKEPTGEAAAAVAEGEKLSPTKAGSKLDLITNVKSQMTGWLGSGIPIPGLRKNEPAPAEPEAVPVEPAEVAEPRAEGKDDDDNSSATGGADSRPASTGGTPTEEQPGGVGNGNQSRKLFTVDAIEVPDMQDLTTKAVAGAKSLGNFLYSAVNKAGAKVSEASAKIKKTVEENSILGEFNREQDAFIKGQEGRGSAAAVPPWVGAPNEPALKEECLSLSTDRRNFVRAPPAGVEFDFDYDKMYPVAVAIMGEDPNLEKMRFDLVPKVITEENFWRNYFYRMSLICQANEADAAAGRQSSADDSQDDDKSASENLIVNEKSSQESIDDAKKLIKSLKVDRENEDALSCEGQRPPSLPLSPSSFRTIERGFSTVPGRSPIVSDIIIRHYRTNLTSPSSYRIGNIKSLLTDPEFDVKRPTVLYAHGYVELSTDESIITMVSAYLQLGGYNVLLLDWSNIAFGNYVIIAKTLPDAGQHVGKALLKLVKRGLSVKGLHLVGHSMGSHLAAYTARYLKSRGFIVPRLTGLDPAYPGFYPPLAAPPMSASDATFVDAIHTDGGGYGAPARTAHADFWPNGGQAKQPGCLSATIPLTNEDFCSHWRSWAFWSESLTRDALLARGCQDYDMFLRGQCTDEPVVFMGIRATPDLRGNFYLRTGAKSPYGLNLRGAS